MIEFVNMELINSERQGDWLQTATGVKFYPLDPREEEIRIEDIAHSLSMQCRFNGHCTSFYSVAEHSVLVSYLVPKELAFEGLMHDASEAYLCDIPRPIKRFIPRYRFWEEALERIIANKYGLPYNNGWNEEVMVWDNRILVTEAQQIMTAPPEEWGVCKMFKPANVVIECLPPDEARVAFMNRFEELYNKRMAA